MRPAGVYAMSELIETGNLPLMKKLLNEGLPYGDCMTVTEKTMAENLANVADYPEDQNHPTAIEPHQKRQPLGHPARQSGPRRRGKNHRPRRPGLY